VTWRDGVVVAGAGEIAEVEADNIVIVFGMEFPFDSGEGAED
jgi:hypothetical protein